MAVMHKKALFNTLREQGVIAENSQGRTFYQSKAGGKEHLKLQLSPTGGKQAFFLADNYLMSSEVRAVAVELKDAQVPDYISEGASIVNLSNSLSPTLDTPSIIASFVDDEPPFRFSHLASALPPGSAILMLDDANEAFQDLSELIVKDTVLSLPVDSPEPLVSPSGSVFSDVSSSSGGSSLAMSAASTDQDSHFFSPDFDVLTAFKQEDQDREEERRGAGPSGGRRHAGSSSAGGGAGGENRYAEMRRKNNLASKRSRVTRREKEREMETQQKELEEENEELRVKVQRMEEVVKRVKEVLISAVASRSLANLDKAQH